VLAGQMSLAGPRPLPIREAEQLHGAARRRLSMKPGLTCLWQVNGRSTLSFAEWMRLDLEYVDRWSLTLDFAILLRTIPAVISGRGAW
jgi:lipopolysaccharide/colanic/teichoic acid biosynthesis glycosyltransferase